MPHVECRSVKLHMPQWHVSSPGTRFTVGWSGTWLGRAEIVPTNSRASSALIRLRRRGRSSTSLISPISLGPQSVRTKPGPTSTGRSTPSTVRVRSRPTHDTFASITTRTASAGTPTSDLACLLDSQAPRLVFAHRRDHSSGSHTPSAQGGWEWGGFSRLPSEATDRSTTP